MKNYNFLNLCISLSLVTEHKIVIMIGLDIILELYFIFRKNKQITFSKICAA